jgi:hypothetical protein
MDANSVVNLADRLRTLPSRGTGRDRQLYRLADLSAAAESASALQAATRRSSDAAGIVAQTLTAANEVTSCGTKDSWLPADIAARERLRDASGSPAFRALLPVWIRELREVAVERPDTGACTLATALQLWAWTLDHFRSGDAARAEWGPTAVAELADALAPVVAARCFVLEVSGRATPGAKAETGLRADLCHVFTAHAAAAVGTTCAELVFGYRRHLVWDAAGCASCYGGDELDELEGMIPGIGSSARGMDDVVEADGTHATKAGPCARFNGVESFTRLRSRLDGCLSGARFAKDRAAAAFGRAADSSAPAAARTGGR